MYDPLGGQLDAEKLEGICDGLDKIEEDGGKMMGQLEDFAPDEEIVLKKVNNKRKKMVVKKIK